MSVSALFITVRLFFVFYKDKHDTTLADVANVFPFLKIYDHLLLIVRRLR